jgi:hypothetical protein
MECIMKHIAKTSAYVGFIALALLACACATRDDVKITDAKSGDPIVGAKVTPIYLTFEDSGVTYETDDNGLAHIEDFGIPRSGYGVEITAPGYQNYFFNTYPTAEHPEGWDGDNVEIALKPVALPGKQ